MKVIAARAKQFYTNHESAILVEKESISEPLKFIEDLLKDNRF